VISLANWPGSAGDWVWAESLASQGWWDMSCCNSGDTSRPKGWTSRCHLTRTATTPRRSEARQSVADSNQA
jgi:hypothetical protein